MLCELSEYQSRTFDLGEPSVEDLRLADELNADFEKKLELRWLHNGKLEVRASSWVGVVVLSNATIHVRPKLAGDELNLVRMIEYAGGLQRLRTSKIERRLDAEREGLLDLICQLLASEAESLLLDGLIHDYTTEEDSLPALRGSLRFREQATRRFGQLDTLECRFDEFNADVFDNQFLAAGVAAGSRLCQSPATRRRLRRIEQHLAAITSTGPHDAGFYLDRHSYTRRNERYRTAHELSLVLIDRSGIDDVYRGGKTRSFSFLLNMNDIFEAFVAKMVAEAFEGSPWRVTPSRAHGSVIRRADTKRTYTSIIPDIVLSNGDEVVPLDCKYKLYEGKKLSTADVYQTFLYAYSLCDPADPRAAIIYPAVAPKIRPELEIARPDQPAAAKISGLAIPLPSMLEARADRSAWARALADLRAEIETVLGGTNPTAGERPRATTRR